jgi:large subunit ribosomal protein L25
MSEKIVLESELRDEKGTGRAKRLRRSGYVPGILYGKEVPTQLLKLDERLLEKALNASGGRLIQLKVGSKSYPVLASEIQRDPIKSNLIHVDFNAISLTEMVKVVVPISLIGEQDMENDGGVLQMALSEVEVECLPMEIPTHITASVEGFAVGSTLEAGELTLPEGVTLVTSADEVILSVVLPAMEEEEEEGEEAESAVLEDEEAEEAEEAEEEEEE